jgi:phosphoribosylformylglycinamidine synthase
MWAPKLPGEGVAMYQAATAMRDCMIDLGIAVDGGKDSLSMATRVGAETVKSPRQLVISAYTTMADIGKVVTPDIKKPGASQLIFIDLAAGKNRLGGSALAQVYGQIGDESPDMDDPGLVKRAFNCVQDLIEQDLILACHDRSDGGLIVTLLEMAFAGDCGLDVFLHSYNAILPACKDEIIARLFSEELGLVIEYDNSKQESVMTELISCDIPFEVVARTLSTKRVAFFNLDKPFLDACVSGLRRQWEETSHQLDCLQANPACVQAEKENIFQRTGPEYHLSFEPQETSLEILQMQNKPKVCILREEGSNSDREMAAAFFAAGFEPWDVTMTDLLNGQISLEMFRGLVAVGGFSYADVPQSAKGWAATILFNEKLKAMFDEFYQRHDTFSLGVCNGCQLFGLLGWVPWRGLDPEDQPRFVYNDSGRFESRWLSVRILPSPSILFKDMVGSVLGVHSAHGEGKLVFPNESIRSIAVVNSLCAMAYTDDNGRATDKYPFCPNGSWEGVTALTTADGRHTAMMPHPERAFLKWQWHYMPEQMKKELQASPWLKMFQNAHDWCVKN